MPPYDLIFQECISRRIIPIHLIIYSASSSSLARSHISDCHSCIPIVYCSYGYHLSLFGRVYLAEDLSDSRNAETLPNVSIYLPRSLLFSRCFYCMRSISPVSREQWRASTFCVRIAHSLYYVDLIRPTTVSL